MLQELNPHPRDKRIKFDEKPHIYYVDGKPMDISVTKWVHGHFPHFDADKIIDKMMKSKKWRQGHKYFGMTKKEIKKQWSDNGKQASNAGTALHNDIECFYNSIPVQNTSKEYLQFLEFHKEIGSQLKPYRTEWTVFDEDLQISGSIDMLFEDADGNLVIYDWKRSKGIKKTNFFESARTECINHFPNSNFWHYCLQLNTYKAILERKYGKKVTGMFLVSLHPIQDTWKRITVPVLQDEMSDLLELRIQTLQKI